MVLTKKILKKWISVLTTSIGIIDTRKRNLTLDYILFIPNLAYLFDNNNNFSTIFNSNSEVNYMIFIYSLKLSFQISKINNKTQKIDD